MARYIYENCIVDKIVDGDTIHVMIDLGFDVWKKEIIRLGKINAPELKGKDRNKGLESKEFLSMLIPIGSKVKMDCTSKDKYGRYVALIFKDDKSISDIMLENNMAIIYE